MTQSHIHTPSAEFRDHLEWEVMRTLRRERRLTLRRRARTHNRLRVAVLLFVALTLGAWGGLASAQIRDAARRDSLLESAHAELALAALRLDLARAQLSDAQRKAQLGATSKPSIAAAEAEHRAMQAEAMRAQLNVEEIRAAAQSPRNELNAPLLAGRDFVTERLRLDLFVAQQRLTAAEQAFTEAERRERVGAAGPVARLEAATEVARARAALAVLAERLRLRREFLENGGAVEQLLRRQQQAELRQELLVTQSALALARERLAMLEREHALGNVDALDVLRAQVEVREREVELQALATRLRRVEQSGR